MTAKAIQHISPMPTRMKPLAAYNAKDAVSAHLSEVLRDSIKRNTDQTTVAARIDTDQPHISRCTNPREAHALNLVHLVLLGGSGNTALRTVALDQLRAAAALIGVEVRECAASEAIDVHTVAELDREACDARAAVIATLDGASLQEIDRVAKESQESADAHQRVANAARAMLAKGAA